MLNSNAGVTKKVGGAPVQILADVSWQVSVGCVVPQTVGDGKTPNIAHAGTPIAVNLSDLSADVAKADAETAMNAVLLHDVDVTAGANNGTALIAGVVNLNRIDADTQGLITTAQTAESGVTPLVVFTKQ